MTPTYSLIIPVLNEVETLPALLDRLVPVLDGLDGSSEVIFVDDGSTDGSIDVLRNMAVADPRLRVVRLSRNFGHQVALTAGLDHARGDAMVIMDGDLQDPPEVITALAAKWREGFQVVYAVRDERAGESRAKLASARWFYRVLGRLSEVDIPMDVGDFRLVDRCAVDAVNEMPEHHRYLRGMFAWVGFDQTGVRYSRDARHAGRTKYPLRKMLAFAADGIVSFSTLPLRVALGVGFAVSVSSLLAGVAAIIAKLSNAAFVPGWASLVVVIAFLGGIQLTVLGVMGQYIARIHDEVKRRPQYLVREVVGEAGDMHRFGSSARDGPGRSRISRR